MTRIVVCLDCPNYRKGGYCSILHKDVGALHPACDQEIREKGEAALHNRLEKRCSKCGRTLPIESFSLNKRAPDGRQSTCKECSKAMYQAWEEKRKNKNKMTMEASEKTIKTKHCNKCGRELPISEFYAKAGTKDGLQHHCKYCHTEMVKASRSKKKSAEDGMVGGAKKDKASKPVVVKEKLSAQQMVDALRADGWEVTCFRTVTEEL